VLLSAEDGTKFEAKLLRKCKLHVFCTSTKMKSKICDVAATYANVIFSFHQLFEGRGEGGALSPGPHSFKAGLGSVI